MCKTRLKMTKISLKIETSYRHCWIFLSVCSKQIRNNKKNHKIVINRQLTPAVFFCKILKSTFRQNNIHTYIELDGWLLILGLHYKTCFAQIFSCSFLVTIFQSTIYRVVGFSWLKVLINTHQVCIKPQVLKLL